MEALMASRLVRGNARGGTTSSLLVALIIMVGVVAVGVARAKDDDEKDWKVLGEAKVDKRSETDEIKIGGDEGAFKRIKFEVRGADVTFKKVSVVYESGDPEQLEVRDTVKRGSQTRPIDLKGGRRAIKKVVMVYKAEGDTD